ncbi:hypothetical protein, partial [Ruegeria sp. HKCCD8929]|uniref:hypothetical protein n=1 Tax=Ruegeria sp. HKCCD8929 TaxID=2683006 RepID=UPI001C2BFC99
FKGGKFQFAMARKSGGRSNATRQAVPREDPVLLTHLALFGFVRGLPVALKKGVSTNNCSVTELCSAFDTQSCSKTIPGRRIAAMVALTRRIAVVLHPMWRDGIKFEYVAPPMVS